MKKQKIALDLDGVTWNVHGILLDIYNKKYHTNYTNNDITFWDFLPEDRFWKCYKKMTKRMDEFKLFECDLEIYLDLLHYHFSITFLTHGIYEVDKIEKKLETFDIYKCKEYNDIIIMDHNNSKVHTNFDYYIDDNPNMIIDIQQYPKKTLLLFTQPWNNNIDVSIYNNVVRVKNWQEIMDYFLETISWKNAEY